MSSLLESRQEYLAPISQTELIGLPDLSEPPDVAERLSFGDRLRDCAEDILAGRICEPSQVTSIMNISTQIYNEGKNFVGPDGVPLYAPDAALVLKMGTLEAWTLNPYDAEELKNIADFFYDKKDELDPKVTLDDLDYIQSSREALVQILCLDGPRGRTLDDLKEVALQRLRLDLKVKNMMSMQAARREHVGSTVVADVDSEDALYQPSEPSRLFNPPDEQWNELNQEEPPTERSQELAPFQPPAPPDRWQEYEYEWPHRFQEPKRSKWRSRLGKAVVAAAAVITGVGIFAYSNNSGDAKDNADKVVAESPADVGSIVPPIQEIPEPNPVDEADLEAEHVFTLGVYDSANDTGTVWFEVERYAAKLGHPKLTMLQAYSLTDRALKYMNISWADAENMSSTKAYKLPSEKTMKTWLTEVTAQNI